jgi:hypothetical protein
VAVEGRGDTGECGSRVVDHEEWDIDPGVDGDQKRRGSAGDGLGDLRVATELGAVEGGEEVARLDVADVVGQPRNRAAPVPA